MKLYQFFLLPLLLLVTAPALLFAQKIEVTVIDSAAKDTAVTTASEQLFGKPSLSGSGNLQLFYTFSRLRKHHVLTLYFQTDKVTPFTVTPQDSLQLVFKDSTYVALKTMQNVESRPGRFANGNSITLTYFLPEDKFNALLSGDIGLISIHVNGGTFDLEVSDERSLKFRRSAALVKN
ncbi:hypothetical protein KXD93_10850 [Mucilaginibacter sp. BJC16-A38]|uniref:hypothetical protein n=1 Tax=Mucilaginibacter phenanthrenivorans TaxID=1234842 RepID=UPI00215745E1|nr:hypothetical protein [Mucilaginibacter phenanthrenivorans]MCR8558146.1 hypothetical protein [Mucilaginibacter phenanthrenivorans]